MERGAHISRLPHNVEGQEPGDVPVWHRIRGVLTEERHVVGAVWGELCVDGGVVQDLVGVAEEESCARIPGSEQSEKVGPVAQPRAERLGADQAGGRRYDESFARFNLRRTNAKADIACQDVERR